jgi:hypothetical protein
MQLNSMHAFLDRTNHVFKTFTLAQAHGTSLTHSEPSSLLPSLSCTLQYLHVKLHAPPRNDMQLAHASAMQVLSCFSGLRGVRTSQALIPR